MQVLVILGFALLAGGVYYAVARQYGMAVARTSGVLAAGLVLLAGILVDASIVFVPFGSVDIVTQNGALTNRILQPGMNFKVPFIQGVWPMNTQIRALEVTHSNVFTRDQQNADTDYVINFSLADGRLREIAENFRGTNGGDTSIADRLIRPRAEYWLKQIEPTYNAADLLTHRSEVAAKLQKTLDADLKPYGIDLAFVSITNISFGPQYQQASEARAAAEQEYEKELTVLKTKKVIAQQNEVIAEGQAAANAKLRASLPSDPNAAEAIVQMQMIQLLRDKWDGVMPVSLGGGSLLNLPQSMLGHAQH
ncbi:MAG: prohibitin family protein [bacterium]|nr:prohibitin family protein [bacterium]